MEHLRLAADAYRSAIVGYIEWGSRIAVINSHQTENPAEGEPMSWVSSATLDTRNFESKF